MAEPGTNVRRDASRRRRSQGRWRGWTCSCASPSCCWRWTVRF